MIRLTPEVARQLLEALSYMQGIPIPGSVARQVSHLSTIVQEQLDRPNHGEDLISTVVQVLMDHRLGRGLNSSTMEGLRSAVLSPSELARFQATLKRAGQCHSCGVPFLDYGVAVHSDRRFYCYRCLAPEVVTCPECDGVVDVSGVNRTIKRSFSRHTCQRRREPRDELVDPIIPTPATGAYGSVRVQEATQAMREATTRTIRWAPTPPATIQLNDPIQQGWISLDSSVDGGNDGQT